MESKNNASSVLEKFFDQEIDAKKKEAEISGCRLRELRVLLAKLRGALLKQALKEDILAEESLFSPHRPSLKRKYIPSEGGETCQEPEESGETCGKLFVPCAVNQLDGSLLCGDSHWALLTCPICAKNDCKNIIGFSNHCRILHGLVFRDQNDLLQTCGSLESESTLQKSPQAETRTPVDASAVSCLAPTLALSASSTLPLKDSPCDSSVSQDPLPTFSASLSAETCENQSRFYITKNIIIGNVSQYIPPHQREGGNQSTHKWMVYVRTPPSETAIDSFVAKVRFFLHPSYRPNDVVEVSAKPFRLTRRGWGEFPIRVQLHFLGSSSVNKPLDVLYHLKLDRSFCGKQVLGSEISVQVPLDRTTFELTQNHILSGPPPPPSSSCLPSCSIISTPSTSSTLSSARVVESSTLGVDRFDLSPSKGENETKGTYSFHFSQRECENERAIEQENQSVKTVTDEEESLLVLNRYRMQEKSDQDSGTNSQNPFQEFYSDISLPYVLKNSKLQDFQNKLESSVEKIPALNHQMESCIYTQKMQKLQKFFEIPPLLQLFLEAIRKYPIMNPHHVSPLISLDEGSLQPFEYSQALNLDEFLCWSIGKQKAVERQRSMFVFKYLKDNIGKISSVSSPDIFKQFQNYVNNGIISVSQLNRLCKIFGFTPKPVQTFVNLHKNSDDFPLESTSLKSSHGVSFSAPFVSSSTFPASSTASHTKDIRNFYGPSNFLLKKFRQTVFCKYCGYPHDIMKTNLIATQPPLLLPILPSTLPSCEAASSLCGASAAGGGGSGDGSAGISYSAPSFSLPCGPQGRTLTDGKGFDAGNHTFEELQLVCGKHLYCSDGNKAVSVRVKTGTPSRLILSTLCKAIQDEEMRGILKVSETISCQQQQLMVDMNSCFGGDPTEADLVVKKEESSIFNKTAIMKESVISDDTTKTKKSLRNYASYLVPHENCVGIQWIRHVCKPLRLFRFSSSNFSAKNQTFPDRNVDGIQRPEVILYQCALKFLEHLLEASVEECRKVSAWKVNLVVAKQRQYELCKLMKAGESLDRIQEDHNDDDEEEDGEEEGGKDFEMKKKEILSRKKIREADFKRNLRKPMLLVPVHILNTISKIPEFDFLTEKYLGEDKNDGIVKRKNHVPGKKQKNKIRWKKRRNQSEKISEISQIKE